MTAPRTHSIDATKPAYVRACIKWDPLERDAIDELHSFGSEEEARRKLRAIPRQLKILSGFAHFFDLFLIKPMVRSLSQLHDAKLIQRKALHRYLAQAKLDSFDLDLCCFCYDRAGKLFGFALPDRTEMQGVVKFHPAFVHSGDDTTGTGDAPDEELMVNLHSLEQDIHKIFFVIVSVNHGFDKIPGGSWSFISTKNEDTLADHSIKTSESHRLHVMVELTREDKTWIVREVAEYCPLEESEKILIQRRIHQSLTNAYLAK